MPSMRLTRTFAFALSLLLFLAVACPLCRAQAALLMEQPYGFFGIVNPTGHTAVYFEHICAETPVQLRRCHPGELGAVISRYQGIGGYDWIAIPLLPYLYATEDPSKVPARVNKQTVNRLRDLYHEEHLMSLGRNIRRGNFLHGGWTELIGVAYERRIYAYRFETTEAQDDALIEALNSAPNKSHFQLLFSNCSDFARETLNTYFPGTFKRSIFPDAGMTTPKQITFKLLRYARKHPEAQLSVFEIPQVPGYRHLSRSNKSIAESLVTTGYAIPLAAVNPYLAGGLFVDYLVRGRYHLVPKDLQVLGPENLTPLTADTAIVENSVSTEVQTSEVVGDGETADTQVYSATPGEKE